MFSQNTNLRAYEKAATKYKFVLSKRSESGFLMT